MSERYDVVVIGGGHNGLTAAALLARRGRKTLLLERRDVLGGLAAGEEFHPEHRTAGVLHDTSRVRRWVVDELGLGKFGLELRAATPPLLVPATKGTGLLLWRDPERAAEELSASDAASYRRYREFLARIAPVLGRLTDRPPPDLAAPGIGDLLGLGGAALGLRRLGKQTMMEVLRVLPTSLDDWLGEWFESEPLKAGLAAPALEATWTGPRSPGTTVNLVLAECTAAAPVAGGPKALVTALEKAARAAGVEIRTGAMVESLAGRNGGLGAVRLRGGEEIETRAIAASCDPKRLFFDLLPPALLSLRLRRDVRNFRARGTTAKVNLALSGYPEFASRPGFQAESIRIGESLEELERAFDAVKYRRFSERPILDIQVPTVETPGLAPQGHHVFSVLVRYVPYELEGGWDDGQKERLYRNVMAVLSGYAPEVESLVVGREVLSPVDLETRYGVTGGHLHHGEHATDQLVMRPTPECARYRTPYEGLFLCGGGSHPGGGLTCAPGALAAREMLRG